MRNQGGLRFGRIIAACLGAIAISVTTRCAYGDAWIRVNLVGYLPDDLKIAILSSDEPRDGVFRVGNFERSIGEDCGPWGPFAHNYRLDFSAFKTPGEYTIRVAEISSPKVRIGADLYRDVNTKLMEFMRLQRCGENPVTGKTCHAQDAIDTQSGAHIDLTGGWHDAADRIKHMITTTYCVAALQLAGERAEAAVGAALLRKIHPEADTLYVQIGDDRDHGLPHTLWHDDATDYGWGAGGPRSAWRATGAPDGPKFKNESSGMANLAGRAAAALALCGDIESAKSLYALARRRPGVAMSVPVKAPYYYMERSYFDDLEWAATELFIATKDEAYRKDALEFAEKAGASEWLGKVATPTSSAPSSAPTTAGTARRPQEELTKGTPRMPMRHGHYECFPYVNLAHWRLHAHVDAESQAKLAAYYKWGLAGARRIAEQNPYRLATPLVWCSTNDVTALATQAVLYQKMSGDDSFRMLATEARDWLFGRNPWGVSFVIDVPADGDAARQPHHLFYLLKKQVPTGGVVDGPVYPEINAGLKFGDFGVDRLARFQSDVGVYHDVFENFSTNEPIIDGTVALRFLISVW